MLATGGLRKVQTMRGVATSMLTLVFSERLIIKNEVMFEYLNRLQFQSDCMVLSVQVVEGIELLLSLL